MAITDEQHSFRLRVDISPKPNMSELRALAFYLPQFYPTPENDKWWGKGFTEWTNVTKAKPYFSGHYQPHLPADLGFYDLRVPEVRKEQASLAKDYGLYGFCYYHYWFNGRRMLEKPLNQVLDTGEPDFPFCLCWANESWKRNWDSKHDGYLISQQYSNDDDRAHIRHLLGKVFSDHRYIKIDGKPLFLIYQANAFPNIRRTIDLWREETRKSPFENLYLCRVESLPGECGDPSSLGFDAAVDFQPDSPLRRKMHKLRKKFGLKGSFYINHKIYDYEKVMMNMTNRSTPLYKRFPGVTPMWDNSARRKQGANIFIHSTPTLYERWLRAIVTKFVPYSEEENFVFINAWNEWAEGNHLEPCQKWGRAYLEATRNALRGFG